MWGANMGIETAKNQSLLYHLTKLNNLDSIIKNGLVPRKHLLDNSVNFGDVADPRIITKREELGLNMYTPFHFHPYSSFDVVVKNTYSTTEFIYICIKRTLARENNFKVLPIHPTSSYDCKLYEYDEGFEQIDWDTLMEKGRNDNYAKQVKMAECLTHLIIPVDHFHSIIVRNDDIKEFVENKLDEKGISPPPYVNVRDLF